MPEVRGKRIVIAEDDPSIRRLLAVALLLPALALAVSPVFLLGYVIDLPAVLVPVLVKAAERREICRAIASLPGFLVQRLLNCCFMLKALWSEFVTHHPLHVYEKGH